MSLERYTNSTQCAVLGHIVTANAICSHNQTRLNMPRCEWDLRASVCHTNLLRDFKDMWNVALYFLVSWQTQWVQCEHLSRFLDRPVWKDMMKACEWSQNVCLWVSSASSRCCCLLWSASVRWAMHFFWHLSSCEQLLFFWLESMCSSHRGLYSAHSSVFTCFCCVLMVNWWRPGSGCKISSGALLLCEWLSPPYEPRSALRQLKHTHV